MRRLMSACFCCAANCIIAWLHCSHKSKTSNMKYLLLAIPFELLLKLGTQPCVNATRLTNY